MNKNDEKKVNMVFCDVKNDVTDKSPDWPPDYHKTARTFPQKLLHPPFNN